MLMKSQGKPVKQTLVLIIFMSNQYPKDTRVSPCSLHVVYTTCLLHMHFHVCLMCEDGDVEGGTGGGRVGIPCVNLPLADLWSILRLIFVFAWRHIIDINGKSNVSS